VIGRLGVSAALLLLLAACAQPGTDPASIDRHECRMEAEAVRIQLEQQELASAPRIPSLNGAMTPMVSASSGFSAYRAALAECLRNRAADRARPMPAPS
jgi:hypothetical protein